MHTQTGKCLQMMHIHKTLDADVHTLMKPKLQYYCPLFSRPEFILHLGYKAENVGNYNSQSVK